MFQERTEQTTAEIPTSPEPPAPGQIGQNRATHGHAERRHESIVALSRIYARLALGTGFLGAVTDRFGLWGAHGRPNVAWGDFRNFIQYAGEVNSFLPACLIPAIAWTATVAETVFGLGLLLGLCKRFMATGSAILLVFFGLAMTISFGIKSSINYSVFSVSAAALLLAAVSHGPGKRDWNS